MSRRRILWVAATFVPAIAPAARSAMIWVEGEKPAGQKMNRHPWWYDKVKRDQLSAGNWISNFAEGKVGAGESGRHEALLPVRSEGSVAARGEGSSWLR